MRFLPVLFVAGILIACLVTGTAAASTPEAEALWKTAKNDFDAGKCVAALVYADRAIALDPAFGRPWNVRGCALHCLGRNTAALEAFAKAAELDPSLAIAPKNLRHVQADISNGAPLDTPAIVIPPAGSSSVPRDGELGYGYPGEPTGCSAIPKEGHAVSFANNGTVVVTGLKIAGCTYGDTRGKKVRVAIWDRNFSIVHAATVPYDAVPLPPVKDAAACTRSAAWAEIDIPDHTVTGDFTVVLFTGSGLISQKEPGMLIVYATPSDAKTSSIAAAGQNRFEDQKIGTAGYWADEIDWMVRVLYTRPAPIANATGEPAALPQATATAGEIPEGPGRTGETPVPGGTTAGQETTTPSAPSGLPAIAISLAIAALRSESGR